MDLNSPTLNSRKETTPRAPRIHAKLQNIPEQAPHRKSKTVEDKLLQWQTNSQAKMREKQRIYHCAEEKNIQHVPNIDPISRRMAEMLMEGSIRPKVGIMSSPDVEAKGLVEPNYPITIKNTLKHATSSFPVRIDLKIASSNFYLGFSPKKQKTSAETPQLSKEDEYLHEIRSRMNSMEERPRRNDHSKTYESKSTYERTTHWKTQVKQKVNERARESESGELKGCTFRPKINEFQPISNSKCSTPRPVDRQYSRALRSIDGRIKQKHSETPRDNLRIRKDKGRYIPISPSMAPVIYNAGFDFDKFAGSARPLNHYQPLE